MRIDSSAPMEVGTTNETLSKVAIEENFGGKSAPEPIPDPKISVGIGRTLVKAMAVEVDTDLLGWGIAGEVTAAIPVLLIARGCPLI